MIAVVVGLVATSLVAVVVIDAPADAAPYFTDTWPVGPNTPSNEIAYYGAAITSLQGREFKTEFKTTSWYDVAGVPHPASYVRLDTDSSEYTIDVPGAEISYIGQSYLGGPGWRISCASGPCGQGVASFTITYHWVGTGQDAACIDAWNAAPVGPRDVACPPQTIDWTQTRLVRAGPPGGNTPPTAAFTVVPSSTDPYEFTFEDRSTDAEDPTGLTYRWDFGNGATSTATSPTYRYPAVGAYTVTLTVTDPDGLSAVARRDVTIAAGLVVNSTGDGGAIDAAERGCDTGSTIGQQPECTLRAAIEAANEIGGGEITFDIDAAGIPSIAAASPLPTVTAPTSIDGTTQAAGWVEVVGTGARVLQLQAGPSLVTGLVVRGGELQIDIAGGTGQVVRANRIGTDAEGTAGDAGSSQGIYVQGGAGAVIEGNVIGTADIGVGLRGGSSGTTVRGNRVGVADDGASAIGDTDAAIIVSAPGAVVTGNTVRGTTVGIELLRAAASGAKVTDNAVGVSDDGTAAFGGQAYGIRSDGAPGATITGNRVAAVDGIVLAGSDQTTTDADGILLGEPSTDPIAGAATGAKATVADNDIALLADGSATGTAAYGITAWAAMADTTIDGNRIGTTQATAVRLLGGSRHSLTRNTIGGDPDAGTPTPVHDGVLVDGSTDVTIGGPGGGGNAIVHTDDGIDAIEAGSGLRIEANRIAAPNAEAEGTGIEVGDGPAGALITSNRVVGGSAGIVSAAPDAELTGNQLLAQSDVGIDAAADGVTISGSVVVAGVDGIRVDGAGVAVTQNRIGLEDGSEAVTGNGGVGLRIDGGSAVASKNLIAGTGAQGIEVAAGATATLRSNRVWETTGAAIDVADGPDAPDLAAAARSGAGDDTRTTLLLRDLPEGDAGTIEVFANSSCAASEAQFLMDITRTKTASETARIIQIKGASTRDHFTVTYTDEDGRTSELSDCVDAGAYPDADGDGSIDAFDEIFGTADDPSAGVYATDNEKLMLALVPPRDPETGVGGGEIDDLAFTSDPAPGEHPAGWSAPYGVMSFRIVGLEPGARTRIGFAILDPSDAFPAGTGYWKYGPQTPGAEPTWWNFAFDEATGTGVVVTDASDVPGIGITRVVGLELGDGLRGDSDGGANGTITDPGGPVLFQETPPTTTTTVPTSTTTDLEGTTTTAPRGVTTPTPGAAGGTPPPGSSERLPRTGTDPWTTGRIGVAVLALGALATAASRRRRRTAAAPRASA
ncbi:MAG: right-handed parallel beta-helix repeat-containing protein [Acidimicrobiales bacterium]